MQLTKHWAANLDDYVIDLAWSSDGTQLAAASTAGPVSLFAATDGAKRHELPAMRTARNAIAFMPFSQHRRQKSDDTKAVRPTCRLSAVPCRLCSSPPADRTAR